MPNRAERREEILDDLDYWLTTWHRISRQPWWDKLHWVDVYNLNERLRWWLKAWNQHSSDSPPETKARQELQKFYKELEEKEMRDDQV